MFLYVNIFNPKIVDAQTHLIQPIEVSYLERKLGKLSIEQLAEILLAIAWSIDLFDTARQ
jgi:hypothetical protein